MFGAHFDSLDADFAAALRAAKRERFAVVDGAIDTFDALLVTAGEAPDVDRPDDIAIVAVGDAARQVEALEAGADEFVAWPPAGASLSTELDAVALRLLRLRSERRDMCRLREFDAARLRITSADVGFDRLLQLICDELASNPDLRALTGADGASVEWVEGGGLTVRAVAGSLAPYAGYKLPGDRSLSALAIETATILWSNDTETDERVHAEACRAVDARSMVVAPLSVEGKVLGVLKLTSSKPAAFDCVDQRILGGMAEMAAGALQRESERAALHQDLEARSRALAEAERESAELRALAGTDPLTGLANRRQFAQEAAAALGRGAGRRPGLAVLLLDLDQFKSINDAHGHAAGDSVLVAVAGWLKAAVRDGDVVGRLGGEEFGIVLPRVDLPAALATAERIRATIESGAVPFDGRWIRSTVSVGVAPVTQATTIDAALRRADTALYRAKEKGRNQITVDDERPAGLTAASK